MNGLHGKGRGNMYIDLQVETPVNLSKEQRDKLEELQASLQKGKNSNGKSTSPESEKFFSKAKEIWKDL